MGRRGCGAGSGAVGDRTGGTGAAGDAVSVHGWGRERTAGGLGLGSWASGG